VAYSTSSKEGLVEHSISRGIVSLLFFLLVAAPAFGQFTSGLQGNVQDNSGANIPNAQLILINLATKVSQDAKSDGSGFYRFTNLGPGDYQVSASASGFLGAQTQFSLNAGEIRNVSLSLVVGSDATNIVVTTQAPLLDTADSREQLTLDQSALNNLPLATRSPLQLLSLTPGVTGISGASTNFNPENSPKYSANGRGENGNMFIVDGLDVDSDIGEGVLNLTPNVDSLAEVTVQANTYAVDYGKASSIQTVMSSKAGTSEYHGFASEYYTYEGLQARGEFGVAQPQRLAPYHTSNMSFGVGGPIIPNKRFFFFATYEPYLALTANGSSLVTYEDPAFVAFAQKTQPNSLETQLFTKFSTQNLIFQKVSSTAQQLFGVQKTAANTGCNTPSTDSIPCSTPVFDQGNFNSSTPNHSQQYSLRVDKVFDKDRVNGLFFRNTIYTQAQNARPAFNTTANYYTFSLQGNETHTFSAHLLNEAFAGYSRIEGFTPRTGLFSVPVVSVTGLGVGFGDGSALEDYIQHGVHWRDVVTYIHGSHALKMGYEGWHGDDLAYFAGRYGQPTFAFKSMINLINNNPYTETMLSYNPVTGLPEADNYGYAKTTGGAFIEDEWKVTRRLTVNYGIRYDNFGNAYPALSGTVLANFHPAAGSFSDSIANGIMTQQSHTFSHDLNWIFSPRGGFAYDLLGKGTWVARGGFGVYRDEFTLGNQENGLAANPPAAVRPTFKNDGSTAAPIFGYGTQNTYPFGFPYPAFPGSPLNAKGGIVGSQVNVGGIDPSLTAPHTFDYTLTLEHSLTRNMVASIGYEGSHSGDLVTNGGSAGTHSYGTDVNAYAGDLLQHPSFASSGAYKGTGIQTRLNTSFGAITYATNGSTANYNSVIAAVKGRFSRRGFVVASYTHGKAMDDWQSYPTAAPPYNRYYSPSPFDISHYASFGWNYELPGDQLHHALLRRVAGGWTLSGITILQSGTPFTVTNTNPLAVSTIGTDGAAVTSANYASELAAGHLQYLPTTGDYNGDGNNTDFPSVTGYTQKHNRTDFKTGHGIFPVCAGGALPCGNFTLPTFGSEGNETPNRFRGPGYADTDFTIKKRTRITERVNLELRLDTFNLFNRVNLTNPDGELQDTTFGQTSSTNPARNMLVGARLNF